MADALPIAVNSRDLMTGLELLFEIRQPGMVWGPPGIGKSRIMAQLAKRLDVELRDIRALLMNPVDVNGLPHVQYRTRAMAQLAKLFANPEVPSITDIAGVFGMGTDDATETATDKKRTRKSRKSDEDRVSEITQVFNSTSDEDLYGQTFWSRPSFLPATGRGILLFDELTAADIAVQAALYQVMLDYRVGDHIMAQGWCPMAASNRYNDKGVSNRMPTPLADRMFHYDLMVEWEPWRDWAIVSDIHPLIIAYLELSMRDDDARTRNPSELIKQILPGLVNRQTASVDEIQTALARIKRETTEGVGMLHRFDPNERSFPTPRSWEKVSDLVRKIEDKGLEGSHVERATIAGKVGRIAAEELLAFAMTYRHGFSVRSAMLNPDTTPVPPEPSMQCAIAAAMARNTTRQNAKQAMEYMNRFSEEYRVMFVKSATHRDEKLTGVDAIQNFLLQNQEIMT